MKVRAAIVLVFALAPSGCMFQKKPAPAPRAPIATVPPAAPPPAIVNEPAREVVPAPVQPPKPNPRPQRNPSPAITPTPVPPAQLPAPQLGEILSSAQQAELNRAVEQSLAPARALLARLRGRQLTNDQSETLGRIRTFADQAQQARKTDLRSAVQLARRAEVLARDLDARIQ